MGLSGKFKQLERSSSVSDLSDLLNLVIFFSSFYSRYNFVPVIWKIKNLKFYQFLVNLYLVFHRQRVSQFVPPLGVDWYIKSNQQDTDAEATLGDREWYF